MKIRLLIALAAVVVLGVGGALAIVNTACKSSHHAWCAPSFGIRHHAKLGSANHVEKPEPKREAN
jgi:hypothetical protein